MSLQAAAGRPEAARRTLALLESRLCDLAVAPGTRTRQVAAALLGDARPPGGLGCRGGAGDRHAVPAAAQAAASVAGPGGRHAAGRGAGGDRGRGVVHPHPRHRRRARPARADVLGGRGCIDLTCVMAARERQRDKRLGIAARRLSWPAAVLAGGAGLSMAANLAQAQPGAWGRVTRGPVRGVPGRGLHDRAPRRPPRPRAGRSSAPAPPSPTSRTSGSRPSPRRPPASPARTAAPARPRPARPQASPSRDVPDEAMLAAARRAAADHQAQHGRPSAGTRCAPASASPTRPPPPCSASCAPHRARRGDIPPRSPGRTAPRPPAPRPRATRAARKPGTTRAARCGGGTGRVPRKARYGLPEPAARRSQQRAAPMPGGAPRGQAPGSRRRGAPPQPPGAGAR